MGPLIHAWLPGCSSSGAFRDVGNPRAGTERRVGAACSAAAAFLPMLAGSCQHTGAAAVEAGRVGHFAAPLRRTRVTGVPAAWAAEAGRATAQVGGDLGRRPSGLSLASALATRSDVRVLLSLLIVVGRTFCQEGSADSNGGAGPIVGCIPGGGRSTAARRGCLPQETVARQAVVGGASTGMPSLR